MKILAIAVALGALAATSAAAQPGRVTSVYTALDVARCTQTAHEEEGSSTTWRCRGHAGVPLIVMAGDDRYDIDAGEDNGEWEAPGRFSTPGPRVEWRLRGGRAFAIIYRLLLSGDNLPNSSVLAVESIGRPGHAGCLVAMIDGRLPNANALARARADARAASFRCGEDEHELHGPAQ
ncbi:MAG: hypothetical protein QOI38_2820 [Sphingomonadales bacterium]|jgi:hypothetical protein|nr:hypothetical protein [Sphingomonadales bacterium]